MVITESTNYTPFTRLNFSVLARYATARHGTVRLKFDCQNRAVPCRASTVAITGLPGTARLDCGKLGYDSN